MDAKKQSLVLSIIDFLQEELVGGNLNDEHKESVEVAVQCLETAFEIDTARDRLQADKVDLAALFAANTKDISEEAKAQAEEFKNKGNAFMKNQLYEEAVAEYTKAIELNPRNAVYFCNRAAAYSRLEKHWDVITNCQEAIKLDPTYGKAYGRLGIAYSNLNKYEEARKAYSTALNYDPSNQMYETNLKLAEERLVSGAATAGASENRPLDIGQFINNPNLISMASQMLGDPSFRDIMSGIMEMGNSGEPGFDALLQAGTTLANRLQTVDPAFVENFRRQLGQNVADGAAAAAAAPPTDNAKSTDQSDSADKKTD